jgi:hypothetical protein
VIVFVVQIVAMVAAVAVAYLATCDDDSSASRHLLAGFEMRRVSAKSRTRLHP